MSETAPFRLGIRGHRVSAVLTRLAQTKWHNGWTLEYRRHEQRPFLFSPPRRRTTFPFRVGVWPALGRSTSEDELRVGVAGTRGDPEPNGCAYYRQSVEAFQADVIGPIALSVGAEVCLVSAIGSWDRVPGRVAVGDLAQAEQPRTGLGPAGVDLERYPALMALIRALDGDLDDASLRRWLEAELGARRTRRAAP